MISYISDTIDIVKIPCHTQAERCIKILSNTSTSVCSNEARDEVIRAKLTSQCDLPRFETKKQFINSLK